MRRLLSHHGSSTLLLSGIAQLTVTLRAAVCVIAPEVQVILQKAYL
jgi:hypothetical protein